MATSSSPRAAKAEDKGAALWRLSLPSTAPPIALQGDQLIEWGGAQRWLCTQRRRGARARRGGQGRRPRDAVPRQGQERGRVPSAGAGAGKIHRELKDSFDPDRVFNRGRLYAELMPAE